MLVVEPAEVVVVVVVVVVVFGVQGRQSGPSQEGRAEWRHARRKSRSRGVR